MYTITHVHVRICSATLVARNPDGCISNFHTWVPYCVPKKADPAHVVSHNCRKETKKDNKINLSKNGEVHRTQSLPGESPLRENVRSTPKPEDQYRTHQPAQKHSPFVHGNTSPILRSWRNHRLPRHLGTGHLMGYLLGRLHRRIG